MSLICFDTDTQYILFNNWISEVHEKAKTISGEQDPIYLVYVDEDEDYKTYVYFINEDVDIPEIDFKADVIKDIDNCSLQLLQSSSVHCNPTVDMSTMSFAEFAHPHSDGGISTREMPEYDSDLYDYAIEDITIEKLIQDLKDNTKCSSETSESIFKVSWPNSLLKFLETKTFDNDIKSMCMFVDLALDHADPGKLVSYIKHTLITRKYMSEDDLDDAFCENYSPMKYTMLEVRSEMMKCNRSLYIAYKQKLLDNMLMSIVEDSRSKAEMEHKISGLVYEILFDSVVNCMNTLWCFIDGVWQECSTDGYIWNFLTADFIEYLISQGERVQKVVMHIMSVPIRSRMMKDIKMRLQDDNFYVLLDSRRNIIRMTNGVYDTMTGALSDPVPSDYVSVVTGVPYQIFDEKSAHLTKLMMILGSIFPDPEILYFFILSCCTFLEGYNSPKIFYIWWGAGNNAKSLVQTLVMKHSVSIAVQLRHHW